MKTITRNGKKFRLEYLMKESHWEHEPLTDVEVYFPATAAIKATEIIPESERKSRLKLLYKKISDNLISTKYSKPPEIYGFFVYMDEKYHSSPMLLLQMENHLMQHFDSLRLTDSMPPTADTTFYFIRDPEQKEAKTKKRSK